MSVIEEIAAERRRQIEVEGWTPEHDDREHKNSEMAEAAATYAWVAASDETARNYLVAATAISPPAMWPWDASWWKPTTRRRDLIKAGALILAAIEQLDRETARKGTAAE